jgi:hypothetical protein
MYVQYQAGQGLLALGQRLLGHPYWGVVLSGVAMVFLFCWAADAASATMDADRRWAASNSLFIRHYWFRVIGAGTGSLRRSAWWAASGACCRKAQGKQSERLSLSVGALILASPALRGGRAFGHRGFYF